MHDWLQILVGLVIVGAVLWAVRRGGQSNPQSTGALGRQNRKLFAEVASIRALIANLATRAELKDLAGELRELEAKTASSSEVGGVMLKVSTLRSDMEGRFMALDEKVSGVAKAADRTEEGVQRIEGILIKKALGQ